MTITKKRAIASSFVLACLASSNASAITHQELDHKIKHLIQENKQLQMRIGQLEQTTINEARRNDTLHKGHHAKNMEQDKHDKRLVHTNSNYSYMVLDPTKNVTRKQRFILEQRLRHKLENDSIYIGGAITGLVGYQRSNTDDKFGYLMRRPTVGPQGDDTLSEAALHTAQVQLTGTLGNWVTGHLELLYNANDNADLGPLQGSNTSTNANQLEVRRGYVMLGNLAESPVYASLGKMSIPFGLMDSVSPFSNNHVNNTFNGLANGLNAGFSYSGFNANVMAVQGGIQFDGANTSANNANAANSNHKLDNVAADINYTLAIGEQGSNLLVGASYLKGSAYCRTTPPTPFIANCEENNAAFDAYAKLTMGKILIQAEYAQTEHQWQADPAAVSGVAKEKLSSWAVGGQYSTMFGSLPVDLSAEYSLYKAGPDSSQWEKQEQIVVGIAAYLTDSVKLFGEIIHTRGYAPFVATNRSPVQANSESAVRTNALMMGVNAAF